MTNSILATDKGDGKRGSIFKTPEFKPLKKAWEARQAILRTRHEYYTGEVYSISKMMNVFGLIGPQLYKGIKPLFLPLSRAVDVDTGLIPSGWLFPEDSPEEWETQRNIIFDDSHWDSQGFLYVHYAASLGSSGIYVVDNHDDEENPTIRLKPLDPRTFMLIREGDKSSKVVAALIIEERADVFSGEDFEYAVWITEDQIFTFVNGEVTTSIENMLGLVPIIEVPFLETGEPLGDPTFARTLSMLDELNQLASYMADVIAKHHEPQWAIVGAEASEMVKSGDNIWFLPEGSKVQVIVPEMDLKGVLDYLEMLATNVADSLPETAFSDLRKKDRVATSTLEVQMLELILKMKRVRPLLDRGLVEAMKMAQKLSVILNIKSFPAFLEENFGFDPERNFIPVDRMTELQIELLSIQVDGARDRQENPEKFMNFGAENTPSADAEGEKEIDKDDDEDKDTSIKTQESE